MAFVPYRAWRFVNPNFDVRDGRAGLQISISGGIEMVDGYASVRQAILLLLFTRPGERVRRPDYGCNLHKLVFMPNDATTHGLAIHYIRGALNRWEPRIDILFLDAEANEIDATRMDILLEYRVRSTSRSDHIAVSYNLEGMGS